MDGLPVEWFENETNNGAQPLVVEGVNAAFTWAKELFCKTKQPIIKKIRISLEEKLSFISIKI